MLLNKSDINLGSGTNLILDNEIGSGSGSKTKKVEKSYRIDNGTGSGSTEFINSKRENINTKKGTGIIDNRKNNGTGTNIEDQKFLVKDSKLGDNTIFTDNKINFKKGSILLIGDSEYNKIKIIDQTPSKKEFKITLNIPLKNNYNRGTPVSIMDDKSIIKLTKKINVVD